MALKADMMSAYEPQPTREAWHLLRKVFLLLLVVIATALGLALLSRQRSNVPLMLFNVLADASLGLLAGFATRLVLRNRHGLLQGLASTATCLVGLSILGFFTGWRSGIGPFQAGLVSVHWLDAAHIPLRLPLEFGRGAMNTLDLVNAVVAMDVSWIALRVWKQAPRVAGQLSLPSPRAKQVARSRETREEQLPPVALTPVVVAAVVPAPKRPAASSSGSRARIRRKKSERAVIARPASALHPVRSRTRHGSARSSRPAVRLAVHEEHKCPYCLEPVKRNDPRGVVECQICHTLHHKDCWDITGNCQVPHLTTL